VEAGTGQPGGCADATPANLAALALAAAGRRMGAWAT
jgi:hypothetical protein